MLLVYNCVFVYNNVLCREKIYSVSRFVVVGVIWRGAGCVEEREPLVAGERGRGEKEGAQVQQNMATQSGKESTTCLQTHLQQIYITT